VPTVNSKRTPVYLRDDELVALRAMIRNYQWHEAQDLAHARWWKSTDRVAVYVLTLVNIAALIAGYWH